MECALSDAIYEESQDLASINPIVNVFSGEALDKARVNFLKTLPKHLSNISEFLGDRDFFAGDKPAFGDFGIFHALDNIFTAFGEESRIQDYENLMKFVHKMVELDGVKEYLAARAPPKNTVLKPRAGL